MNQIRPKGFYFFKRVATAIAAAFAVNALAQSEIADRPAIEEVIVTALKREQAILDTPISVSAFTGTMLERIGASQLGDFLAAAPGTSIVDSSNGDQVIAIRGISSLFGDSPVGYYLDEVPFNYIGVPLVPDVRTFDLERIEVLRGPQGTLYGASSLGGTVRILTNDPEFNEFHGKVDLTGSGTKDGGENYGAKALVNIPLVDDQLALRLVGTTEDFDGWLDEPVAGLKDVNDREIDTFRAKLRWAPTDSVELVLGAWAYRSDTGSSPSGNSEREYLGSFVPDILQPSTFDYDLFSALLTINSKYFDIVSSTSYMDSESETSGFFEVLRPADTFAQELRFNSVGEGRLSWTAGGYYRDLTTGFLFTVPPFPPTTQDTKSESWALFGELTYAFTDQLEGTIGLRQFEDTRNRDDTVVAGFDPDTFELIFATVAFEEKYSTTNPRFNLAWRPNENVLVYANAAKGFRSGFQQPGISLFIADLLGLDIGPGADPETAWSYEIGTKTQLADGRVVLEAAVYYIDWKNLQTVISVIPGALGAIINAGKAAAIGLDFSITGVPTEGLEIGLSGNINESEYKEDVFDIAGIVIADGQRIQGFPALTLTGFASYRRPIGSRGFYGVGYFSIQHTSERTLNFGSITTEGDKITQGRLRVGIESGKWGAYLFVNNLFDEDGMVTGHGFQPGFEDVATRLRPRTIGLNVRFDW